MLGQLGRAVKAIDSKSIGVTRVSSSLTAVALFKSALRAGASRYGRLSFVVLSFCHLFVWRWGGLVVGWWGYLFFLAFRHLGMLGFHLVVWSFWSFEMLATGIGVMCCVSIDNG